MRKFSCPLALCCDPSSIICTRALVAEVQQATGHHFRDFGVLLEEHTWLASFPFARLTAHPDKACQSYSDEAAVDDSHWKQSFCPDPLAWIFAVITWGKKKKEKGIQNEGNHWIVNASNGSCSPGGWSFIIRMQDGAAHLSPQTCSFLFLSAVSFGESVMSCRSCRRSLPLLLLPRHQRLDLQRRWGKTHRQWCTAEDHKHPEKLLRHSNWKANSESDRDHKHQRRDIRVPSLRWSCDPIQRKAEKCASESVWRHERLHPKLLIRRTGNSLWSSKHATTGCLVPKRFHKAAERFPVRLQHWILLKRNLCSTRYQRTSSEVLLRWTSTGLWMWQQVDLRWFYPDKIPEETAAWQQQQSTNPSADVS